MRELRLYSEAPGNQGSICSQRMAGLEGRSGSKKLEP